MSRTTVVMNVAGYNAYRNDPTVVAVLEDLGERIRARAQANVDTAFVRPWSAQAGDDITLETVHDSSRAVVFIATATEKARTAEHVGRALNRAVSG